MKLRYMDLDATERCNLRCKFCFGHRTPADMTDEIADAAIEVLRGHLDPKQAKAHINWVGSGEAMLRWEWVLEVSRRAQQVFDGKVRFSLPTNMTIMPDAFLQAWSRELHGGIMASIDGPPEVQRDQRGSDPEVVERNAAKIIAAGYKQARSTVMPESVHTLMDGVRYLDGLGFERIIQIPVYELDWTDAAIDTFQEQVHRITDWYMDRMREGRYVYLKTLEAGLSAGAPLTAQRRYSCGAGRTLIGCDVQGDLYPCHRYFGKGEFKAGSVYEGPDEDAFQRFSLNVPRRNPECFASPGCGGGCPWVRYTLDTDRVPESYCRMLKIMAREAERAYGVLTREGNQLFRDRVVRKRKIRWKPAPVQIPIPQVTPHELHAAAVPAD